MTATPLAHVTPNIVMNAQLLDASYDAGIKRFVFISSSAVYPPTGLPLYPPLVSQCTPHWSPTVVTGERKEEDTLIKHWAGRTLS